MTYLSCTSPLRVLGSAMLAASAAFLSACQSGSDSDPLMLGTTVETRFFSLIEGKEQGSGTVTVTDVRRGAIDDLAAAGFELDDDQLTMTPHYVDVTFTNTNTNTNTGAAPVDLREPSGIDADDDFVPSLTVVEIGATSTFADCPSLPHTLEPGAEVDGCAIVLVPQGRELERISYLPDVSEDFVYWETGL